MTEQTHTRETGVPARYPLGLAALGLLLVIIVGFTQRTFNAIGWAGVAMILIGMLAWVLLAPEQAKAALSGRTVRYGGTSFVVTVVFLVALTAIYTVVKDQNLRLDLTERNEYSLNETSRKAIEGIGVDPATPEIKILAFYGTNQASRRDQDVVLFDDYAATSNGKISYEFIDPDRNPVLAQQYGVQRPGQIAVVALDENGDPDVENAELVNLFSQEDLTNAILSVAASGDFRAYFVSVEGGLSLDSDMTLLRDDLTNRFDWTMQEVSLFDLTSPASDITLNDPAVDGETLVIVGGSQALTDEQLAALTDYLDNGGNLVIFAAPSLQGETSLSTSENLSDYLFETYGLRFEDNVILDQTQALQTPLRPVATDFGRHYITSTFDNGTSGLIFEAPHSITVAEGADRPERVTITELARSTEAAYAKTDIDAVLNGDFEPTDSDPTGPFVLAAAAENRDTGSRVVLFSSASIAADSYALGIGVANLDAAFNSLVWVTHFNDFFRQVTVPPTERPQDTPIFASTSTLATINFVTVIVIPFGILGIGALVWWVNRERNHA